MQTNSTQLSGKTIKEVSIPDYSKDKYRIREYLESLPYYHYKIAKKEIISGLGITPTYLYQLIGIEKSAKQSMKADQLIAICKVLNRYLQDSITIDSLIKY